MLLKLPSERKFGAASARMIQRRIVNETTYVSTGSLWRRARIEHTRWRGRSCSRSTVARNSPGAGLEIRPMEYDALVPHKGTKGALLDVQEAREGRIVHIRLGYGADARIHVFRQAYPMRGGIAVPDSGKPHHIG